MADDLESKKRKLPPLSPRGQAITEDSIKKVVKKKKKKPIGEGENEESSNVNDGEPKKPKRRAKSPSAPSRNEETEENKAEQGINGVPKKKKRKPKTTEEEVDKDATADRRTGEDVTGSKASLLTKESEKGTPRKKGKKKKVRKSVSKDEFADTILASDLTYIAEDVVPERKKEEDRHELQFTSANILRSQPTEKLYIETNSGFKGENKKKLAKKLAEEEDMKELDIVETPMMTTMEFGLQTHKVLKTFCLFLHGVLAGMALWHIVIVYVLSYHDNIDFLEHYCPLALPVQCTYYILLALCAVSACDRCDVGNTSGRFFIKAFSLQNTAVAIVIYFFALVVSLYNVSTEDKINLFDTKPDLWSNSQQAEEELSLWKTLNTVRGVAIILGWVVLSIAPNADRLGQNLRQGDDEILGKDVELSGVTAA